MKKVLLMLSLFSALSMCACERAEGSTGEAAQESPEGGTADYDENYTYEGIEVWSESHGGNGLWSLMTSTAYHNPGLYQRDRIVHSETGRQLAEAILFAERYSGVSDAALREFLHQKGLAFEVNATGGERWLLFAPHAPKDEQIPVVQVFTPASLYGMSMYYRLIELAAQGEFMLVMLGIESGSKVSLVPQIVDELAGRFPIDEGRIYSVGHSHYGAFAQQLASAYPSRTAGIAQLSGYFGCMNGASEAWRGMDMPVINVIGYAEMNSPVPMNTDAPAIDQIPSRYQQLFPMTKERRIKTWQDRLYELNCEVATTEQMEAASTGSEVERTLGFPVARGATVRAYGMDYYIGDLTNSSGRSHARFAVMDNFPHSASPYELDLTWHFLKRFARDTATGACIERYQSDALYPEPEGEPSAQENYTWSTRQQNVTARDGSTTIQGELFLPDRQGKMPLVIFSHEFLQTHASGTPYGEYFAAKGIATYAFDFTNGSSNGRSDFTKVSGLTETHDLEDVLAAARQWDFVDSDRIILVGASFGCWATAVCGIDHQDAVAGMVLLYPGLRFLEDIESRFHRVEVPRPRRCARDVGLPRHDAGPLLRHRHLGLRHLRRDGEVRGQGTRAQRQCRPRHLRRLCAARRRLLPRCRVHRHSRRSPRLHRRCPRHRAPAHLAVRLAGHSVRDIRHQQHQGLASSGRRTVLKQSQCLHSQRPPSALERTEFKPPTAGSIYRQRTENHHTIEQKVWKYSGHW